MRRIRFVPIAVLLLGFLGAFVRHVELKTAFDLSGLPRRGAAASVALILLTVLAAAIALALCLAARRYEAEGIYKRAFPIEGYGLFAVKALAGIAVTVCAPLLFLRPGTELMGLEGGARWPFVILMALAGFGMTVMAYAAYTRKNTAYLRPGSVMPALLCCGRRLRQRLQPRRIRLRPAKPAGDAVFERRVRLPPAGGRGGSRAPGLARAHGALRGVHRPGSCEPALRREAEGSGKQSVRRPAR